VNKPSNYSGRPITADVGILSHYSRQLQFGVTLATDLFGWKQPLTLEEHQYRHGAEGHK
jgi:hypothetical protein